MTYLIVQMIRDELIWGRFESRRGIMTFLAGARYILDDRQPLDGAIAEIAGKRQEHERVVLSLDPNLLFMRELDLPIDDRRKARQVLPLELKGETALDTDELVFDAIPMASGRTLAVWCRRGDAAELIDRFTRNGLEPEVVSAACLHWGELIGPGEYAEAAVAVSDGTAVSIIQAGRLLFSRALAGSEPLAEIERSLAAMELSKGIAVQEVLLHSGAARLELEEREPFFRLLPPDDALVKAFSGDVATARDLVSLYALAMAAATGAAVDFRSGSLAYTAGRARMRAKFRTTMILAAVLVLLVVVEAGSRFYLVKRDLNSINNSLNAIYKDIFPNRKKPVDPVGEVRAEIRRLSGSSEGSSVLEALRLASEAKGPDITGFYEAEIDNGKIRLAGDARSVQAANDFRTRAAAVFANPEVGEIKSRADGSISFVFRGTLKEDKK